MHTVTDPKLLRAARAERPDECVCLEAGGLRLVYPAGSRAPLMLSAWSPSHLLQPARAAAAAAAAKAEEPKARPPAPARSRPRGR